MPDEEWLDLRAAFAHVKACAEIRMGGAQPSDGAALQIFRRAMSSGAVRWNGWDPIFEERNQDTSSDVWVTWKIDLDKNELSRRGSAFRIPSTITNIRINAADLDWWLQRECAPENTKRRPKTKPGALPPGTEKTTKLAEVRTYIAEQYPNGIPAGASNKQIARATGASERTVRRARTGK